MKRKPKKQWYAIAVRPGSEGTVRRRLRRQAKIDMIKDLGRVLVPTLKILVIKDGKKRLRRPKKFPGYVLAECHYCPTIYKLVRECKHTFGFLPYGQEPVPVAMKEIAPLLAAEREKRKRATVAEVHLGYRVGDRVRIKEGAFQGVEGLLVDVDEAYPGAVPVVAVEITILGKPHRLQLSYWKCKKA